MRDLVFLIILVILVVSALAGCDRSSEVEGPSSRYRETGLWIYVDTETGCEYLSRGSGSLYPRMNKEGRQVCR